MSRDAFAMLIATVVAVLSVQADGFVLGDERLSVVFSSETGWPDEVRVEGQTVLCPSKAPPFEANVPFIDRERTNGVWRTGVRPLGVTRLDERTAKTSVVAGPWTVDCWVELHPDELMIRRWYEISQDGTDQLKLQYFWAGFGQLSAAKGGEMFKPVGWPPSRCTVKSAYHKAYCGWGPFPAILAGGDNGWSAMVVPDELRDYSDRMLGYVLVDPEGWTFLSRHDIAGYVKRGVRQRFGDDWLVLRRGNADGMLAAVRDWQRVSGQHVPADRPPDLHRTVLYSHHFRGASEYGAPRTNGVAVTAAYLPYLKALGVDTIWLRPIEDGLGQYNPRDYYKVDPRVGTAEEVRAFVATAQREGIRVWKDAVMHGGRNDCPRSKEHPEWVAWIDETGKTYDYWCYDYNWPTWVTYFADYVRHDTRFYGLDGWREDVPDGSKCPNWNPAIPYARASFSQLQGALAQQRAIRAAIRDVNPRGATLSEAGEAVFGNVSDSLYDQFPCHRVFPELLENSSEEVAAWYQRFLYEKEMCFLPDQIWCRYPESHDSVRAAVCYGQDCANALMASTAWSRNYTLIHNDGEDGCFETWRRIFRIRKSLPELVDGTADYASVRAPAGVLAFLRELGDVASVVLVNFNGRRTRGAVTWPGGTFETDLPAFGYDVVRVRGRSVREVLGEEPPAFEPEVKGELAVLEPMKTDGWTVFRFSGATRWYAHAADGSFESPWFRRYAGAPWVTQLSRFGDHRPRRGCIRWDSSHHPFGYDRAHAEVGAIRGSRAMTLEGLRPDSLVHVWEAIEGEWEGVAIAVRGDAAGVCVRELPTDEALAFREAGSGDPRLTPEPGGWRYETDRLRVRFLRSGAIVGAWRRVGGDWKEVAGAGGLAVKLSGVKERIQSQDCFAAHRFAHDEKGNLKFVVSNGCLALEKNWRKIFVRYRTELTFDDGDRSFGIVTTANLSEKDADFAKTAGGLSCEWRQKTWGRGGKVKLDGADKRTLDPATRRLDISARLRIND